jgi:hypothetical protein
MEAQGDAFLALLKATAVLRLSPRSQTRSRDVEIVPSTAMSSRSSRRSHPASDTQILNNIEALILAQAVWELGANAWSAVSRILSKHPLISRPKSFFNAQVSRAFFILFV